MKTQAALLLLGISCFAQDSPPLQISAVVDRDTNAERIVSFRIKNAGTKPIQAYVAAVKITDGARIVDVYKTQQIAFTKGAIYREGAEWTEELSLAPKAGADGQRLTVSRPEIDFVLFEDGTRWGPDQFRLAARIRGEIAGVSFERARLSDLLRRKGIAAVVNDILDH